MKIYITSVYVTDQEKAFKFYTEILGFIKKTDVPVGKFKLLTVVSPEGPAGIELLLEPNENSAANIYQKSLFEQGVPVASFEVDDIEKEYNHLKTQGVRFTMNPTQMDSVQTAIFDDTCGNLIQIVEL